MRGSSQRHWTRHRGLWELCLMRFFPSSVTRERPSPGHGHPRSTAEAPAQAGSTEVSKDEPRAPGHRHEPPKKGERHQSSPSPLLLH